MGTLHSDKEALDLKLPEMRQKFPFTKVLERVFVVRVKRENQKRQITTPRITSALIGGIKGGTQEQ